MSDTVLQIIPFLPEFTPSAEDAAAAESAVTRAFASADAVTRINSPSIVFRDAGANFESVSCPQCGSEVDQEWWEQAMSAAAESDFEARGVVVPCCQAGTTLESLTYEWPQGFSRFVIEVRNPGADAVPPALRSALGPLLGGGIRIVWARY